MINTRMGAAAIERQMKQLESQLEWAEDEVTRLNNELDRMRTLLWLQLRVEARHAND